MLTTDIVKISISFDKEIAITRNIEQRNFISCFKMFHLAKSNLLSIETFRYSSVNVNIGKNKNVDSIFICTLNSVFKNIDLIELLCLILRST